MFSPCSNMQSLILYVLGSFIGVLWGCQLPHDWRPQTEACRAELVEIIVFAKVLAVHQDTYSVYNYLPWQYDSDLFYSAEIELLCDQAWGSMLEVPAGSRLNITGLGYFPCHSYTVLKNNSYYFFLRILWHDTSLSLSVPTDSQPPIRCGCHCGNHCLPHHSCQATVECSPVVVSCTLCLRGRFF